MHWYGVITDLQRYYLEHWSGTEAVEEPAHEEHSSVLRCHQDGLANKVDNHRHKSSLSSTESIRDEHADGERANDLSCDEENSH